MKKTYSVSIKRTFGYKEVVEGLTNLREVTWHISRLMEAGYKCVIVKVHYIERIDK